MVTASVGYVQLTLRAEHDPETGEYVSHCLELGISSSGSTLDEAFENIADAAEVYLNTLEDEGERERVFRERRITIVQDQPPNSNRFVPVHEHEYVSQRTFSVPLPAA